MKLKLHLFLICPLLLASTLTAEETLQSSERDLTEEDVRELKETYGQDKTIVGSRDEKYAYARAWIYGPPKNSVRGNCFRTLLKAGGNIVNNEVVWERFQSPYYQIQQVVWLQSHDSETNCANMEMKSATTLSNAIEESTLIRLNKELPRMLSEAKESFGKQKELNIPDDTSKYRVSTIEITRLHKGGNYDLWAGDTDHPTYPIYNITIQTRDDGRFEIISIGKIVH